MPATTQSTTPPTDMTTVQTKLLHTALFDLGHSLSSPVYMGPAYHIIHHTTYRHNYGAVYTALLSADLLELSSVTMGGGHEGRLPRHLSHHLNPPPTCIFIVRSVPRCTGVLFLGDHSSSFRFTLDGFHTTTKHLYSQPTI